jgi:hypothetical protein
VSAGNSEDIDERRRDINPKPCVDIPTYHLETREKKRENERIWTQKNALMKGCETTSYPIYETNVMYFPSPYTLICVPTKPLNSAHYMAYYVMWWLCNIMSYLCSLFTISDRFVGENEHIPLFCLEYRNFGANLNFQIGQIH